MSADLERTFIITFVGMLTVFIVLVVLSYCFMAMGLLTRGRTAKPTDSVAPEDDEESVAVGDDVDVVDEEELAVAIMAALAAYMDGEHVVTSIKRVEDSAAWSRTGRHDQMAAAL